MTVRIALAIIAAICGLLAARRAIVSRPHDG
jgi:hypothetical protein